MPAIPLLTNLDPTLVALLQVAAIFLVTLTALLFLRALLLRNLRRLAARTATLLDDHILHALTTPTLFWCVALALSVTLQTSTLVPAVREVLTTALTVLLILSMTLVSANIAGGVATHYLRQQSAEAGRVPGLGQTVIRSSVLVLGLLVLLNALGVEITPLLTALGVGGLAVALALQETLSQFFAGIHILLDRPFTIGNFVRLENGQEGRILDIGWRTTRVVTLLDEVIVLPNNKIAGSIIMNYHMPVRHSRVFMDVSVAYTTDTDLVDRVLLEELERTRTQMGEVRTEPPPEVLMYRFGEYSLDFRVRFHLDDIAKQTLVMDRLHRNVFRRFQQEGIVIPYPTRANIVSTTP